MHKTLFCWLTFLPVYCFSQSLLLNGGFEDENTCTEYKINCAPEAWVSNTAGFNNYFKDANRAYEGQHCMAIEAGNSHKPYERTFLRSPLLCGMRKGARYRLEFFIKSPHPILDSIGIYFGPIDPLLERKPIHKLAPSFYLGQHNSFQKDSGWQRVVADYQATGDEAFITIANFARNDVSGPTGIQMERHFFVFLDNISLLPLNPAEHLCADWKHARDDIYEQNERHEFLQRSLKYRRNDTSKLPLMPGRISTVDTLILPDIFFATAKKDFEGSNYLLLDSFCRAIKGRTVDSLVIEGHTDNTGTTDFNEQLAMDRAGAVGSYLRNCSYFFRVPFYLRGWGSRRPVTNNETPENRQRNRRVELFLYLRE